MQRVSENWSHTKSTRLEEENLRRFTVGLIEHLQYIVGVLM